MSNFYSPPLLKIKIECMEKRQIIDKYNEYLLTHGKRPGNVFMFCKEIGIEEGEFYQQFGSFEAIEKMLFTELFHLTIEKLNQDPDYLSYDSKTRLISFYYTFFENLTANRSIVLQVLNKDKWQLVGLQRLSGLRSVFISYIQSLGIESLQIPQEKLNEFKDKTISELAWGQLLITLKFWMEDDSPSFEKTDIFIEKSLQASFDIVSLAPFRNLIDLGKFLFKEKAGMKL